MKEAFISGFMALMFLTTPSLGAGSMGLHKLPSTQEVERKHIHEWRQKVLETLLAIEKHLHKRREEGIQEKRLQRKPSE